MAASQPVGDSICSTCLRVIYDLYFRGHRLEEVPRAVPPLGSRTRTKAGDCNLTRGRSISLRVTSISPAQNKNHKQ